MHYRWLIVALLFFATTINYLDRQIIGLLKPILEKEFNWTETDFAEGCVEARTGGFVEVGICERFEEGPGEFTVDTNIERICEGHSKG